MSLKKKRDHEQIIQRLKSSLSGVAQIKTLRQIETPSGNYPFQSITLGDNNSRHLLISAGIHGDEPAGVETICAFLESGKYKPFLSQWEITLLPCINPYGFEYDTRENHNNKDLNRLFKDESPLPEVVLTKSIFKPSYFDLTLELHEDCDSDGYYLFQKSIKPGGLELGYKIIDAVKNIIQVNLNNEIDDIKADAGVIHRLKNANEMEWWPMAIYSLSMNTGHSFTLETPTNLPLTKRIEAHLSAIETVLNECPE